MWQLILRHAAEGRFDTVVVWRRDRFGRDPVHNAIAERELKKAGVRIESTTTGPQDDTEENELFNTVVDAISLYEARKIAARCHMGRKAGARTGAWVAGRAPMGYERDPKSKHLRPLDPVASEIRGFFQAVADGTTIHAEAQRLRRPMSTLLGWMGNRVYLGELRYDGVVTPGAHPALVTVEIWDRAHANSAFRNAFFGRSRPPVDAVHDAAPQGTHDGDGVEQHHDREGHPDDRQAGQEPAGPVQSGAG
jgi:site-specific DNA recombinase